MATMKQPSEPLATIKGGGGSDTLLGGTRSIAGTAAARGLGQVDPRLVQIIDATAARSPYDVQIFSGKRYGSAGGSRHNTGNAIDIALIDPTTGQVIPNYKSSTGFPIYADFARIAREEQMRIAPDMANQFRWGGGFSDKDFDLMHFDFKPGGAMAYWTWKNGGELTAAGAEAIPKFGPGWIYANGERQRAPQTQYASLWGRDPLEVPPQDAATAIAGLVDPGGSAAASPSPIDVAMGFAPAGAAQSPADAVLAGDSGAETLVGGTTPPTPRLREDAIGNQIDAILSGSGPHAGVARTRPDYTPPSPPDPTARSQAIADQLDEALFGSGPHRGDFSRVRPERGEGVPIPPPRASGIPDPTPRPDINDPSLTFNAGPYEGGGPTSGPNAADAVIESLVAGRPDVNVGSLPAASRSGDMSAAMGGSPAADAALASNPVYDDWTRAFDIPGPMTRMQESPAFPAPQPSTPDEVIGNLNYSEMPATRSPPTAGAVMEPRTGAGAYGDSPPLFTETATPDRFAAAGPSADELISPALLASAGQIARLPGTLGTTSFPGEDTALSDLFGGEQTLLSDLGAYTPAPAPARSPSTLSIESMRELPQTQVNVGTSSPDSIFDQIIASELGQPPAGEPITADAVLVQQPYMSGGLSQQTLRDQFDVAFSPGQSSLIMDVPGSYARAYPSTADEAIDDMVGSSGMSLASQYTNEAVGQPRVIPGSGGDYWQTAPESDLGFGPDIVSPDDVIDPVKRWDMNPGTTIGTMPEAAPDAVPVDLSPPVAQPAAITYAAPVTPDQVVAQPSQNDATGSQAPAQQQRRGIFSLFGGGGGGIFGGNGNGGIFGSRAVTSTGGGTTPGGKSYGTGTSSALGGSHTITYKTSDGRTVTTYEQDNNFGQPQTYYTTYG